MFCSLDRAFIQYIVDEVGDLLIYTIFCLCTQKVIIYNTLFMKYKPYLQYFVRTLYMNITNNPA